MNADERGWRKILVISAFICVHLRFQTLCFCADFVGEHFSGSGDVEYVELLDTARRQFEPDPQYQNLSMLYEPSWNGLVEGPTWDAWWIQNSYGGTYCWLPFAVEPWTTFIQNSQKLWFDHIGDGKTPDKNGYVAPDGCLVDAANLKVHYYRQGDGRHDIHDWGMEFTAAGLLLQSELLLISRDDGAIEAYLPKLQRAANFIETRRDPASGLYLGGVACNLLAPSFSGFKKPDGSHEKAFHAGLQVTYIAALDRLIELEKLAGHNETASAYANRRDLAKQSLSKLVTEEGYFLNSIDPDGTKHGVFGAPKHGYFESSVNHDAICFRVAGDEQAKKIYAKVASIPQLRPHDLIIPNYPSYDDLYDIKWHLWQYGLWVNGGHWSTCEARMIMAYNRLGKHDDARKSMKKMLDYAKRFRMDNPLVNFGGDVYQPQQPINITFDAFGPSAAMIRGLFEYHYSADKLVLIPHIPAGITRLEQHDPIRFGEKRIFLTTTGTGHVSGVTVNNQVWTKFSPTEITLPYGEVPDEAKIEIRLGYSDHRAPADVATPRPVIDPPTGFAIQAAKLDRFIDAMNKAGEGSSYESAHAKVARRAIEVIVERNAMLEAKELDPLPDPAAAKAAQQAYLDAATKLFNGLTEQMNAYGKSDDARKREVASKW